MTTITAILEPDVDGTLHVPLPETMRQGKVKLVATLTALPENEAVENHEHLPVGFGSLKGKISMADNFDAPLEDFKDYME